MKQMETNGETMTYLEHVQEAREQVAKSIRNVKVQRERLVELRECDGDTWLATRLLASSEESLKGHRERLRDLLVK